jgi:hypothetical protein
MIQWRKLLAGVLLAGATLMGAGAVAPAQSTSMPLPLKVVGTQILNSKNEPVLLRGVNCASMEWTSDGQGHILQSVPTTTKVTRSRSGSPAWRKPRPSCR